MRRELNLASAASSVPSAQQMVTSSDVVRSRWPDRFRRYAQAGSRGRRSRRAQFRAPLSRHDQPRHAASPAILNRVVILPGPHRPGPIDPSHAATRPAPMRSGNACGQGDAPSCARWTIDGRPSRQQVDRLKPRQTITQFAGDTVSNPRCLHRLAGQPARIEDGAIQSGAHRASVQAHPLGQAYGRGRVQAGVGSRFRRSLLPSA